MAAEADLFEALKYRIVVDNLGTRIYYNSAGQLHRDEGPAVILANGTKGWYQNDQLHREDGPAIEWGDGTREWYLQGVRYTKFEYHAALKTLGIQNEL